MRLKESREEGRITKFYKSGTDMQENFLTINKAINMEDSTAAQQQYGMFCYAVPPKQRNDVITKESSCNNNHQKKSRTVFTKKQILRLEGVFYEKRYLTIKDREELSKSLSLSESQVKVWFQNRRNKWKREMAFKVEYAKFNMPNHHLNAAGGRRAALDANNLPNSHLMLPTSTEQMSNLIHMTKYDAYTRNDFTEQYHHTHQQQQQQANIFHHESPQSYSPSSINSVNSNNNNNELCYQDLNTPVIANSLHQNNEGCSPEAALYTTLAGHYDNNNAPPTNTHEYGAEAMYTNLHTYTYDVDKNLTSDVETGVVNTALRDTRNDSTGVVYTTLSDCRYGDTKILNLQNQCEYGNSY